MPYSWTIFVNRYCKTASALTKLSWAAVSSDRSSSDKNLVPVGAVSVVSDVVVVVSSVIVVSGGVSVASWANKVPVATIKKATSSTSKEKITFSGIVFIMREGYHEGLLFVKLFKKQIQVGVHGLLRNYQIGLRFLFLSLRHQ